MNPIYERTLSLQIFEMFYCRYSGKCIHEPPPRKQITEEIWSLLGRYAPVTYCVKYFCGRYSKYTLCYAKIRLRHINTNFQYSHSFQTYYFIRCVPCNFWVARVFSIFVILVLIG